MDDILWSMPVAKHVTSSLSVGRQFWPTALKWKIIVSFSLFPSCRVFVGVPHTSTTVEALCSIQHQEQIVKSDQPSVIQARPSFNHDTRPSFQVFTRELLVEADASTLSRCCSRTVHA